MGSKTSFKAELSDPKTFYLVDAQLPMAAACKRIETCWLMHSKTWVSGCCYVTHCESVSTVKKNMRRV